MKTGIFDEMKFILITEGGRRYLPKNVELIDGLLHKMNQMRQCTQER
jgi:hypothetical protein